ncbi:hypothetical protein, partial [Nocardia takedensis]|uniref:hypothetical protein n=1 Tax=Nocardia takedensis TaxID=259390 RepID=UPI0005932927
GYSINLPASDVDAWRFDAIMESYEVLTHSPQAPDAAERCRILDVALNCWSGTPYQSFVGFTWASAETARLAVLELIGILAALAILLAAAWILTHPLRTTPCDATAAHSSPARSEAYYIPLSGYAHQTMRTLPGMTWALPHRTSTGHACG